MKVDSQSSVVSTTAACLSLCAILLALCSPTAAQQPSRVYRVGFLAFGPPPAEPMPPTFPFTALRQGMRELGYVEGSNLVFDLRWAAGKRERLPTLASELVQRQPHLIVATGASAVRAAKNATQTIPIVMAGAPDPVGFELVESLARPGGNVTGISDSAGREIEGKRLELLKETVAGISRVGVVLDSASRVDITLTQQAAHALGLTLIVSPETATPDEFRHSFALLTRGGAQGLYAPETPVNVRHRSLIIELAVKHRLPAIYGSKEFVEAGGMMSYGASFTDIFRRSAVYVDRILKGAKPADLPVEQPTKFELVINLKTAKQVGLAVAPEVLMRADKVLN